MNTVLASWNHLDAIAAAQEVLPCCSSQRWARELANVRPFSDEATLLNASDAVWLQLDECDWDEAFASHPRIGEKKAPAPASTQSANWSLQEQRSIVDADDALRTRLQQGNEEYECRFGRTYIVCATGKSAEQMLAILDRRLTHNGQDELREAVEQQRQITQLRLRKWLQL